ncbi:hypothetical protein HK101_003377 [Irineochytrium annulatum]|nr:hypothetical protein HK101_003377 [Irineochytrium annulatum]
MKSSISSSSSISVKALHPQRPPPPAVLEGMAHPYMNHHHAAPTTATMSSRRPSSSSTHKRSSTAHPASTAYSSTVPSNTPSSLPTPEPSLRQEASLGSRPSVSTLERDRTDRAANSPAGRPPVTPSDSHESEQRHNPVPGHPRPHIEPAADALGSPGGLLSEEGGRVDTGYQSDENNRRASPMSSDPGSLLSRDLNNLLPSPTLPTTHPSPMARFQLDPHRFPTSTSAPAPPGASKTPHLRRVTANLPPAPPSIASAVGLRGVPLVSQLILACENGDVTSVRNLLEMGVPVNCRDENSAASAAGVTMTPLIAASRNGRLDVMALLIEYGASMEDRDQEMGGTALFHAAICGHPDTVRLLLSLGADRRAAEWTGCTVMYAASFHGHVDIVRALVDAGAGVDDVCAGGTALHAAVEGRQIGVVRLLLQRGAEIDAVDAVGRTALWLSCQAGFLNAVECLLDHGADIDRPSSEGTRPLWIAIVNDHEEVAKRLVERGADVQAPLPSFGPKDYGYTPLHGAAHRNHPRLAHALIVCGASPRAEDTTSHTPLHLAAMSDNAEVAEVLLWHDPALANLAGGLNRTPLFLAALWGAPRTAALLLSYSADPNLASVDPTGINPTPLRAACQSSHVDMVSLLLRGGADVNAPAGDGSTCLHVAIATGCGAVAGMLIRAGADVDARLASGGETPLHLATRRKKRKPAGPQSIQHQMLKMQIGDSPAQPSSASVNSGTGGVNPDPPHILVRLLLDAGADANTPETRAGMTPLHLASREGDLLTCCLLIEQGGASLESPTHAGYAPLAIASLNSRVKVVAELLGRGADARATSHDGTTALHAAAMAPGVKQDPGAAAAPAAAGAAMNAGEAIVGMLVEKGAEVDAVDVRGDTPLKVASRAGNLFVVRALIAAGASLDQLAWPEGEGRR